MQAVVASGQFGSPIVVTDKPKPKLRPTWMIVRTVAIAANPADNLYLMFGEAIKGSLLGCDYAGIVEEVGSSVIRNFKKGDKVCGCSRAGDPMNLENGTAAEYIVVKADLALHIPDDISFEQAATTGVTFITVGRCLYKAFDIPFPDGQPSKENRGPILIYGGSSTVGTALIQFAKLSGFEVITTCSPHNFELCKSFGADHVLDYHDLLAPSRIKALANDALKLCIDCISLPGMADPAAFCASVLSSGGKYSALAPMVGCGRDDIQEFSTVGYSFYGEPWSQLGESHPASQEDFAFSMRFAEVAEHLLKEGKIQTHPVELREGGLTAFPQAIEDLKNKKVSGKKLVVKL